MERKNLLIVLIGLIIIILSVIGTLAFIFIAVGIILFLIGFIKKIAIIFLFLLIILILIIMTLLYPETLNLVLI